MQDELRPILLRRMKEDVEDLPQKEEIVVRVQLTRDQRGFYKAIFAKQVRTCRRPSSPSCLSPAVQQLCPALMSSIKGAPPHHIVLEKSNTVTISPPAAWGK